MDVTRKEAAINITGSKDDFPGTFEVVLSAPTLDRDGDTLKPEDWKTPLPDHITFDMDHGMSVATTVGSGVPEIDAETGNLVVRGTFSSLPRAQEVRTLVNEGHIRTTSVAFMSESQKQKDGKTRSVRELLNGAFVAIPSNREAVILSSKTYNPDQPRDDHGRFGGGAGASASHPHAGERGVARDASKIARQVAQAAEDTLYDAETDGSADVGDLRDAHSAIMEAQDTAREAIAHAGGAGNDKTAQLLDYAAGNMEDAEQMLRDGTEAHTQELHSTVVEAASQLRLLSDQYGKPSNKSAKIRLTVVKSFGNPVADELSTALSDAWNFYTQAKGAHWNVEGIEFAQYHELFDDISSDVYGSIDPLAENLRKLGFLAPTTMDELISTRSFPTMPLGTDPKDMAASLAAENAIVLNSLKAAYAAADGANEQGIANFLAERIDMHQKWAWQLRSSVKEFEDAELKNLLAELQGVTTADSADTTKKAAANAAAIEVKSADEVAVETLAVNLIVKSLFTE